MAKRKLSYHIYLRNSHKASFKLKKLSKTISVICPKNTPGCFGLKNMQLQNKLIKVV